MELTDRTNQDLEHDIAITKQENEMDSLEEGIVDEGDFPEIYEGEIEVESTNEIVVDGNEGENQFDGIFAMSAAMSAAPYTPLHPQFASFGVLTTHASTPFRTGPGASYTEISSLSPLARGTQLTLLGLSSSGNWYYAQIGNIYGWILASRISRIYLNGVTVRNVTTPIRTGPGTSHDEIRRLERGTEVSILGISNSRNWYRVRHGDVEGWILASVVDRINLNVVAARHTNNPLRREPRAGGEEFANLNLGDQMISLGTNDTGSGWHLVRHGSHVGWLSDTRLDRINLNVVSARHTNNPLRREPRAGGEEFANPNLGDQMISLGTNDTGSGWHLVRHGSHVGWLSDTRLDRVDLNVVAARNTNNPLRREPRAGGEEFANPDRGVQMVSFGTNDTGSGWHLVQHENEIGWLSDTRVDRVNFHIQTTGTSNPLRREPRAGGEEFANPDRGVQMVSFGTNDTGSGWHLVHHGNHIGWLSNNRTDRINLNIHATGDSNPLRREPRAGGEEFANPNRGAQMISFGTNETGSGWHLVQYGNQVGWLSNNRVGISGPPPQPPTNSTRFALPLRHGQVTDVWGSPRDGGRLHRGMDFQRWNHFTDPVLASASGRVVEASIGWNGGQGNRVIIRHTINDRIYYTLYAHMSRITVSNNQLVTQGDSIGNKGTTGLVNSNGHVHFEIHRDRMWNQVNPQPYLFPSGGGNRGHTW